MKGAKAAVQCLLEEGVDTIFGYPGGMILPLYDALYDEKKITQILTTHDVVYSSFAQLEKMALAENNGRMPSEMIPHCTECGGPMVQAKRSVSN